VLYQPQDYYVFDPPQLDVCGHYDDTRRHTMAENLRSEGQDPNDHFDRLQDIFMADQVYAKKL